MKTKQQLLDLKEKVMEAKATVDKLTGQETVFLKQIKDNFDCDDIESARRKSKAMIRKINNYNTQISESVEELEEKYNI